jgi:uncharacterized cupin superfamily protein
MSTKNYQIDHVGTWAELARHSFGPVEGKIFLKGVLGLTGCEISLNRMPAGKGMPFLHAHRENEEVYIVVSGEGIFHLDGEEFPVSEGSVVRVAPSATRGFRAGNTDLHLVCVQAKAGGMEGGTIEDGFRLEGKASWMT